MHPHFVKEDAYALPPLGLLPLVAKGTVTPEMAAVLKLTDKLRQDLDAMLEEHKPLSPLSKNLLTPPGARTSRTMSPSPAN
jgi:hypothetical protein